MAYTHSYPALAPGQEYERNWPPLSRKVQIFLIQDDSHLLSVIRYVERNPLRAKLVKKAENWRFSSLSRRLSRGERKKELLSEWPIPEPKDYLLFVNTPQTKEEEENIRVSVVRGKPFGSDAWAVKMIEEFALEAATRDPWRPKRVPDPLSSQKGT